MRNPKVYVVALNFNSWEYTLCCLESLFKSSYENYCVIVCDNNSDDESEQKIKDWAAGKVLAPLPNNEQLKYLIHPPLIKPILIEYLTKEESEKLKTKTQNKLILIQTGSNLGFAGGCNVGIRFALSMDDSDYIWILNNDTILLPSTLHNLVSYADRHQDIGICGSTLLSANNPNQIQALGGARLCPWTGTTKHIGAGMIWPMVTSQTSIVENKMDYVVGASMLVSRRFFEKIGLLEEGYFLYYEELDIASRARHLFRLGYAENSILYHVEGGSSDHKIILYYYYRSMIRFTYRYRRKYLPFVIARIIARFIFALINGEKEIVGFFINSRFLAKKPDSLLKLRI